MRRDKSIHTSYRMAADCIYWSDLDKAFAAATAVLAKEKPTSWALANSYTSAPAPRHLAARKTVFQSCSCAVLYIRKRQNCNCAHHEPTRDRTPHFRHGLSAPDFCRKPSSCKIRRDYCSRKSTSTLPTWAIIVPTRDVLRRPASVTNMRSFANFRWAAPR